jgi:3',5'-cyclic AMP phosphodiesterase CpdA
MFTLAHLSDPHLGPLPRPGIAQLVGKRVTGFLSWTLQRRAIHEGPVLGLLAADLKDKAPDHVAVTGDIINIALPDEFTQARAWLYSLGAPASVTVVPGNHDAYVRVPWERACGLWTEFMTGSDGGDDGSGERPVASAADFPFVRRRGPVALIGVSTALPMPPFSAAGKLGPRQLELLQQQLTELGREGLFRIVLIHHPPYDGSAPRRKRLHDSAAFRQVIAAAGAELILHGHTHRSSLTKLATPNGAAPVIGVPSASARKDHHGKGHGQYHLYAIERDGAGWRLTVEVRGVAPSLDHFVREGRFTLAIPQ